MAANCEINAGWSLSCRDNTGGIKSIYILSGSITTITEASEGLISDISGVGTYYEFQLPKNVGSFTETPTPSLENGTVFYTQVVEASFSKLQSSLRNQVKVLAANPALSIVVETENGVASGDNVGKFFLVGRYRGATLTAGAGTTGTAMGDANQYALTFQADEPVPSFEIQTSGSLSDALTTIVVG